MKTKRSASLIIASILMALLGIARGSGGLILISQKRETLPGIIATENTIILLSVILMIIGLIEIISAIGVWLKNKFFFYLGIAVTILFVLDGALNGYMLFGKPGDTGTLINICFAALILIFLYLAKDTFKKTEEAELPVSELHEE